MINYETGDYDTYVVNAETRNDAFAKFFMTYTDVCFDDVYDYQFYDEKMEEDGWYAGWL